MPLDTFHNLPEEKKTRIMNAAIGEFAEKGYAAASVEEIASVACVAKGSMYQYFHSKKEFFMYIFDCVLQQKIEYTSKVIEENRGIPFFDLLEKMLFHGMEYARKYPAAYNIYLDINERSPQEIRKEVAAKVSAIGNIYYLNYLKQAADSGELKKEINIELATFIVYSLLKNFSQYLIKNADHTSETQITRHIKQFILILKNGIANKGD